MFRPADNAMERMVGYAMQRGVVHNACNMIRVEEAQQQQQWMYIQQMQEMELMQMQAMGGAPYGAHGAWPSEPPPLLEPSKQPPAPGPKSPQTEHTFPALNRGTAATPPGQKGSAQPRLSDVRRTTEAIHNSEPAANGAPHEITPSSDVLQRKSSINTTAPPPADSTAYAANSLYNTMPSAADSTGMVAAFGSAYNGNSMYGAIGNSAYGADLQNTSANAPGANSMFEIHDPTLGPDPSSPTQRAPQAHPSTTPTTVSPALQRRTSGSTLVSKSSSGSADQSHVPSTTHRSRAIRRLNSDLKRRDSMGSMGSRSRASRDQSVSAEHRSTSPHDQKHTSSKAGESKSPHKHRSSSPSASSSSSKHKKK